MSEVRVSIADHVRTLCDLTLDTTVLMKVLKPEILTELQMNAKINLRRVDAGNNIITYRILYQSREIRDDETLELLKVQPGDTLLLSSDKLAGATLG